MTATPHYHLVPKEIGANLRFRRALLLEAGNDQSSAAQIKTMCSEDLLFSTAFGSFTYDPRSRIKTVPFIPYGFQEESMLSLAECIESGQDAAVYKSRDMGASWMCLAVIEWFWRFHSDLSFLLVSRNEDYVDKRHNPKALLWKVDFLHRNMPRWMLPSGRWLGDKDPNRKLLHLGNADNGSVIDGESTTGDAGRGDRRTAMLIDEHAAFELDSGFKVLRSTRDTTNCRIFNSTPQGAANAFYEVCHKTSAKRIRLHWSAHPEKNPGLYKTDKAGKIELLDDFNGLVTVGRRGEDPRQVLFPGDYPFEVDTADPKVRSPWYDHQCARCVSPQEVAQELDIDFLGSDYPFFDPRAIADLIRLYACPPLLVGDLEFDHDTLQLKRFVENIDGLLQLWIPLGPGGRLPKDMNFTLGADVSAGTGASNSAASVADRETGEKLAVLITPNTLPEQFADMCMALGYFFNKAFMAWDATGPHGQTFTNKVVAHGYGNIYYRRNEKKVTRKISDQPGYFFNRSTRAVLLGDYRAALGDLEFINHSKSGLNECLQFIRKPDGVEHSASLSSQDPSGARTAHGDEVIADALCSLGVRERRIVQKAKPPKEPVGSLAWRRKCAAAEAVMDGDDQLGPLW